MRPSVASKRPDRIPVDARDAKLAVDNWEDVANEEDIFHQEREKVLLGGDNRNNGMFQRPRIKCFGRC